MSADIEAGRQQNPTNHAVADALGISAATYGRIKTVAKAAKEDPCPPCALRMRSTGPGRAGRDVTLGRSAPLSERTRPD